MYVETEVKYIALCLCKVNAAKYLDKSLHVFIFLFEITYLFHYPKYSFYSSIYVMILVPLCLIENAEC